MSLLYSFVKHSGRIGLPLFFGKLEINGKENVPIGKPYIVAPNHQSAFLDAIIMGVYCKRPMHFLTRSDVFGPPFGHILRGMNMMPVYRLRDGYEKLKKNEEVFAKCDALLNQGIPVLIFPEGNMGDGHFLRPLTKGTSRMAIQAQASIQDDVMILPVGINYFHHDRPRYKCIVNYGKPLRVRDYLDLYNEHPAKGLIKLKNDLSENIKELLILPSKEDYETKVKALNQHQEQYDYKEIKKRIAEGNYQIAKFKTGFKWIPKLLSIFNPLSIGVVHFIMNRIIKERQFTSSIKYILGLILSGIWWVILFISATLIWNWKIGIVATIISIVMLFLRSDLKKRTDEL